MERFTNAAFGFEVTDVPAVGVGGPQDRAVWDADSRPALARAAEAAWSRSAISHVGTPSTSI